jgi:hypothetical protein
MTLGLHGEHGGFESIGTYLSEVTTTHVLNEMR